MMSHNYDSCQPTCCMFWSAFWALNSTAFSDFESFVIMSKLLQMLVITLIFEVFVGMSKVRQPTQQFSCSRYKINDCRAQAALLTMMSGLHGFLRADMTWVGSGEKEEESFHVCFSAAKMLAGDRSGTGFNMVG